MMILIAKLRPSCLDSLVVVPKFSHSTAQPKLVLCCDGRRPSAKASKADTNEQLSPPSLFVRIIKVSEVSN